MSLNNIKRIISDLEDREKFLADDSEEQIEKSDIYDVLKILDRYKKEEALSKIYKAKFDYHRDGNTISIIITFNNLKKSERLHNLFNSEYFENMFRELNELNISNSFKKRIADKKNYTLTLFGDSGIYKTPYYRI